jgi:hypothetical protein
LSYSRLCAGLSVTSDQPWVTKFTTGCPAIFEVAPYTGFTQRLANISAHEKLFQVSQTGLAGADFNKDDHADVIFQDQASGWAQVWFLGGTNGTTILNAANLTLRNTWRIAAVADFNQDSHPDIVWQDPASGAVQVWLMTGTMGTQIGNAITLVTSNSWRIVAAADFNQDGHGDLLWQDPLVGISAVWLLGGAHGTTVVGSAMLSDGNTWRIAAAADFNSDGRTDVMWQDQGTVFAQGTGFTQIWFLGGSQGTTVTAAVNLVQTNPWRIAATGDLNRDGRPDLIWQDPVTGASQAWIMGGAQGNQILNSITLGESNSWRIAGPR